MNLLLNFIDLFVESAPWLLFGFFIAGLLKTLVPEDFLARHLGQPGVASTIKAALLGAPLPLCSCGVIPAAIGLRRAGASKAATTSFLISTPETGVDSISISYALLGPVMAIMRPFAAIVSAITAGLLVGRGDDDQHPTELVESDCCSGHHNVRAEAQSLSLKIVAGLRYTFVDLLRDIVVWLLIGLVLAAAIKTFVPQEFLAVWGQGFSAYLLMAAIGIPMYICATASTPVAAGLLFAGVSPGAVLVFMLVGPATNIATLGVVKTELGQRSLAAYLGAVIGVAFIFGFALDAGAQFWGLDFSLQAEHAHQIVNNTLAIVAAVVLALLMTHALLSSFMQPAVGQH